jgi:LacI family transcriptional regulator
MTRTRKKAAPRSAQSKGTSSARPGTAKVAGIKPGRNATINDIARLASVSKKTVSRVINQSPLVQEATRARIQAVIDKFGYVPDPQARGLAFRKSFLIGLVYDNPNAQYIVNCMEGALDAVRNSEYELVVHPCDRKNPDYIAGVRRFVERQKLRGVILLPPVSENDELTRALTAADCAYVRITYTQLDDPARIVISNDRLAVAEVANYLISLGHKRIGYIAGPSGFRSAIERLAGFREAVTARGLSFGPELIVEGGYTYESGVAGAEKLLA